MSGSRTRSHSPCAARVRAKPSCAGHAAQQASTMTTRGSDTRKPSLRPSAEKASSSMELRMHQEPSCDSKSRGSFGWQTLDFLQEAPSTSTSSLPQAPCEQIQLLETRRGPNLSTDEMTRLGELDPSLRSILWNCRCSSVLKATIRVFLLEGIQTVEDAAYFWSESQSFASEVMPHVEAFGGDNVIESYEIFALFLEIRRSAESACLEGARILAAERLSIFAPQATASMCVDLTSQNISQNRPQALRATYLRYKALIPVGGHVRDFRTWKEGYDKDVEHTVMVEVRKQDKLCELWNLAVSLRFIDPETSCDASCPHQLAELQELATRAASRLPVPRLSSIVSTLKRWQRWCLDRSLDPSSTIPFALGSFLKEVSQGGPTASSGVFKILSWVNDNLGASFPLSHFMVNGYRMHAVDHTASQAAVLEPAEFMALLQLAASSHHTLHEVYCLVLMAATGCIRWAHLQRTRFNGRDDSLLQLGALGFYCTQGKSRIKGARPGYPWALPEIRYGSFSLHRSLNQFWKNQCTQVRAEQGPFLIPALYLSRDDLWEVTSQTSWKCRTPMTGGRFVELLRGALIQTGKEPEAAVLATFNCLRRFIPTLGHVLGLQPQQCQELGSWVDVPSAAGAGSQGRKQNLMSVHYSGARLVRSAKLKVDIMNHFLTVMKHIRSRDPSVVDSKGCWRPSSVSWANFTAQLTSFPFDTSSRNLSSRAEAFEVSKYNPHLSLVVTSAW